MKCNQCPRECNVDRAKSLGFCRCPEKMIISKVMLHKYEEPYLTDQNNLSGAIFFGGCSLRCVYCQNYSISHSCTGKAVTPKGLVELFKDIESRGASNIDLVTPTHYASKIIEALKIYKPSVPVIWNTSGYEKPETIQKLDGLVDIYLTDLKYHSAELAKKYSQAGDYPKFAISSLKEMKKQVITNVFVGGVLKKGIVVRHLVLPGQTKDSFEVLNDIKKILGKKALVSIMSQYTPMGEAKNYQEINRSIKPLEYKAVVSHALSLGLTNALVQDLDSASDAYTPCFNNGQIFE